MTASLQERFTEPAGWQWDVMHNARGRDLRFGYSLPAKEENKKPRAHILYVEGLSEFAEKSFELAREFNQNACGFWVLDRQGLGRSGRYLKNEFKQHAENFDFDVADIIQLARDVIPDDAPLYLMGHSTGGLLTLHALHEEPSLFAGAMITAPLLGVHHPILQGWETLIARLPMPGLLRERFVPGGGEWRPREDKRSDVSQDAMSSDPERMTLHDHWMIENPELRIGSPTLGWVKEACMAMTKARQSSFLSSIETPLQIFTAGNDLVVDNKYTLAALAKLKNAEHYHYDKGKHELLMETDDIRSDIVSKALDLINRTAPAP